MRISGIRVLLLSGSIFVFVPFLVQANTILQDISGSLEYEIAPIKLITRLYKTIADRRLATRAKLLHR